MSLAELQHRQRQARFARAQRNAGAVTAAVRDSAPPTAEEVTRVMTGLHMSYADLKAGTGTDDDVVSLGLMLNVGVVRAAAIGPTLVKAFEEAGAALQECEGIKERHGRYGFTGPGILSMNAALELYEQVLAMSSLNQMDAAEREVVRQMREHARKTKGGR